MSVRSNTILGGLGLVGVVYILVCGYFYFMQEQIIFHPSQLPEQFSYGYDFRFQERVFSTSDGHEIHSIHARTDSTKGLVIYFHGNQGNNYLPQSLYRMFLSAGYDVVAPDYRGYGKSSGAINNEDQLLSDMYGIYRSMLTEYSEKQITLVGYSLGSAVAAGVAAEFSPERLILWAPFYSLTDMKDANYPFLPDFLLKYKFQVNSKLETVDGPVYIFFGEDDRVLPVHLSKKLTTHLEETDTFYHLPDQGHGGFYRNPRLQGLMNDILN